MIKQYSDILNENLIKDIFDYFKLISEKDVWSSTLGWQEWLTSKSSSIITHKIKNKNLSSRIKESIEKKININFNDKKLFFIPSIYVWSPNSFISWHDDHPYPYNGTIYLNEEWDINNGGIFLYKDNKTKSIFGVEPIYNTMVVNSSIDSDPHNLHCVTCIAPNVSKRRITIQWRTLHEEKNKIINLLYQ